MIIIFADGQLRRHLIDIARSMAETVRTAFCVVDGIQLCQSEPFDVLLLVGDADHLRQAKAITELGGWAADMPIVAVCSGSLDLAEARASGVSLVIPGDVEPAMVWGALTGAMAEDARAPTWWVD